MRLSHQAKPHTAVSLRAPDRERKPTGSKRAVEGSARVMEEPHWLRGRNEPIAEKAGDRLESRKETVRIEGFSDAVFAIAITLLALDLKVPPTGPPGLLAKLFAERNELLAFLASFGTIAAMWVLHHRVFFLMRRTDGAVFLFNILTLLGVSTIPFWTAVAVAYLRDPERPVAAVLHVGIFVMTTLFLSLLWRHAVRHRLVDEAADPDAVRNLGRLIAVAPILYLVSAIVASVNGALSSTLNTVFALFFIILK